MRLRPTPVTLCVLLLVAAFTTVSSSWRPGIGISTVSAAGRNGTLQITKNCTDYFAAQGAAGQSCTITSSTLAEIPAVGTTRVYYDQAFGLPAIGLRGFLDSNVLLYLRPGDWAVGRCTLDGNSGTGVCTFSDGVGSLAGFRARVAVAPAGGFYFTWEGTYSFRAEEER